jgi:hypothetical protein
MANGGLSRRAIRHSRQWRWIATAADARNGPRCKRAAAKDRFTP